MYKVVSAVFVICLHLAFSTTGVSSEKITLSGSSTIAPLVLEIGKIFEKDNAGVRIDVQTGGSSRGIADARRKLVQVGMVSRAIRADETDIRSVTIAIDGVGFIVHKDNPITNLNSDQAKSILTGSITDWAAVGGKPGKIVFVHRADGRSEVEIVSEFLGMKPDQFKPHLIAGENAHTIKSVAGNSLAIAYISIGHALKEAALGSPVKLVDLNKIPATAETVRSGAYTLSRPLNLITTGEISVLTEKFIKFASSEKVHAVIASQSFVPAKN